VHVFDNILLELTNVCNLTCSFCPQSITKRKKQFMSKETIEKAVKEIGTKRMTKTVSFHLLGEPLLNRNCVFAIEHSHNEALDVELVTNGTLLSKELIDTLLSLKPKQIKLSVRNVDAITYQKNCATICFDQYIYNIVHLICRNIEKGAYTRVTLMAFKDTLYSAFFQRKYGYDSYINYDTLRSIIKKCYENLNIDKPVQIEKGWFSIRDITEIAKNTFLEFNFISIWDSEQHQKEHYYNGLIGNCGGLKKEIGILCTGDIVPCCRDYDGVMKLGNIHENSIEETISNPKARMIRSALDKNILPTEFCKRCRGGPSFIISLSKQIGSIIANSSFFSS